jgi:hypothetical protein
MNTKRWPAALGVVGALIWTMVRLPIYYLLLICEPIVRIGGSTLALLGIFSAIVLKFSGSAPHFPFWGALLFFGCCGLLPVLHRAALRWLAR